MHFSIEYDSGDAIEGFLVPDGFSSEPSIVVEGVEGRLIEIPCDRLRETVRALGRHSTGLVGFHVGTDLIPDLPERKELTIWDGRTGLLIYRRPLPGGQIERKLLRLETSLNPQASLDRALARHFQYAVAGLEHLGHETTQQVFLMLNVGSVYASGQLLMRNYEDFFEHGLTAFTLLQPPHVDCAERLMLFAGHDEHGSNGVSERDMLLMSGAFDYFAGLDLESDRAIVSALKRAPKSARAALHSPLMRQLTAVRPDAAPERAALPRALDLLSRFEVVGTLDDPLGFANDVGGLLGLQPDTIPVVTPPQSVVALAERLRAMPVAERLFEEDVVLHHFIGEARQAAIGA